MKAYVAIVALPVVNVAAGASTYTITSATAPTVTTLQRIN